MGVDDILRKVRGERDRLSQIRDATGHPSLTSAEREELRKEACRIKGKDYVEVRRAEQQAEQAERMRGEVRAVGGTYDDKISKLYEERSQHVKQVPGKHTEIGGGYTVGIGGGTWHKKFSYSPPYESVRFGHGKKLSDVERRIEQAEKKRDEEIKEEKRKYGK